MKFTDGNWLLREGVELYNPVEVHEVKKEEGHLFVHAFYKNIEHRGDTLRGPLFTIELFSPRPEIIGVRYYHYRGGNNRGPSFELNQKRGDFSRVEIDDRVARLTSGNICVEVSREKSFALNFYRGDEQITTSSPGNSGYILDKEKPYFREQLNMQVGEKVYGLGERFTPFVKNGQVVDIWNKDGGTSSEQAYKNVPFYLTDRGYGVFVNHPEKVSFEVASERVSRVQFSVPGEVLEYYVINGPTPKKVLEHYTDLTGKPSLPPAWSFGLWLTTSFTTDYDEKTVNRFIEGMEERNIPLDVFHFDCFWMKEFHWCNFLWDERVFPDPEGMLSRLKKKGLKISVWINPYIAQRSYLFDEGREKGYLLQRPDGSVWQGDKWQPGMGIVDFTNPEARNWYKSKLQKLLDMGVDCFKTDFGERIPLDVEYYDSSDPETMHNYYSYLYNKTVFELLTEQRGRGEAVLFARSGTAGSQKYPVHWGGDCDSTYESMAESLRGGLSLCMSGFGFWSHDIGGFESKATPDLYKRWAAFGLLSSHSRLHGSGSYRVPWLFDEKAVDVLRYFTELKCRLMPYIFQSALIASRKGIPVMRSLVLEYPDDPACKHLDRQYMLGDSLLVAPVFSSQGEVSYYLPPGIWTNFITGDQVEGGRWVKEKHGYMSLPLMVRPNSLIPVGTGFAGASYDYADDVVLHLFYLESGERAECIVSNPDGEQELEVVVENTGERLNVKPQTVSKPFSILLRNIENNISRVENGSVRDVDRGKLIFPGNWEKKITVEFGEN